MAQNGGPEAVNLAVANTLSTYLTSTLDAIWTEAGDVATVPKPYGTANPINIRQYSLDLVLEFPTVQVLSDSGAQMKNAAPVWAELRHNIRLIGYLKSDSHKILDQMTLRFIRGIWRVLMAHPLLDGSLGGNSGFDLGQYKLSEHHKVRGAIEQMFFWDLSVHVDESV